MISYVYKLRFFLFYMGSIDLKKITIFGLAGTGTSTVAKLLCEELGFEFMSSGNIFREMAVERGVDVYELNEIAKRDSSVDASLDERVAKFGRESSGFIFESRLAWNFISDSVKVKMVCDLDERVRRVVERDGGDLKVVREKTLVRERAEMERYQEAYGIEDYTDDSHFDFVLDTTRIGIDEVVLRIREFLDSLSN